MSDTFEAVIKLAVHLGFAVVFISLGVILVGWYTDSWLVRQSGQYLWFISVLFTFTLLWPYAKIHKE